jgi:hypothetical protein
MKRMKKNTVGESKTKYSAPHLVCRCPECGGYEVVVEVAPIERQHHANNGKHVVLRLRCSKHGCPHAVVIYYGCVRHRGQFRIRRFPRSLKRFPRFPHDIVAILGPDFSRIILDGEKVEHAVRELGDTLGAWANTRALEVVLRAVYEKGQKDAAKLN